jgi:hypothetical protein
MELIADILMVAGAMGAGFYCFVLARRLARFNDLERGMGGAVATLSAQVDDLTRALSLAHKTATASTGTLETLTERADTVARKLELLVATMHDLPTDQSPQPTMPESDSSPELARVADPVFMRHGSSNRGRST